MKKCKHCGKEFEDGRQLGGHMMLHVKNGSTIQKEKNVVEYNKNPSLCNHCRQPLPYDKRYNKYCSKSCAAKVNNSATKKKSDIYCLNCGKNIGSSRQQKKYCSLGCQQEHYKTNRINEWLESGNCIISSKQNHYIREYIRDSQHNKCAICGIDPIWNGKPLVFVLDHISGDSTDNSRENLRLICPHCDSQLPTYKGRNVGSGRHYRRKRYSEGKSY